MLRNTGVMKLVWLARTRPAHLYGTIRGLVLFYLAALARVFFPARGVELGPNVRLQKNRSLMAEASGASIYVGADSVIYENARVEAYGNGRIRIGSQSILGDIRIISRFEITIGKRFLSSWNVFIEDFDPHPIDGGLRGLQVTQIVQKMRPRFGDFEGEAASSKWESKAWAFPGEEIVIGDDVWVGANATILKGVRIGEGCIVAAGAVVLRGEYPARSLIAGNPAKVVKKW